MKAIITKDGVQYEDAEIASQIIWHIPTRPKRIALSKEMDLIFRIDPQLSQLYGYLLANPDIPRFVESDFIYIYVDYILPEHEAILTTAGATIENQ